MICTITVTSLEGCVYSEMQLLPGRWFITAKRSISIKTVRTLIGKLQLYSLI